MHLQVHNRRRMAETAFPPGKRPIFRNFPLTSGPGADNINPAFAKCMEEEEYPPLSRAESRRRVQGGRAGRRKSPRSWTAEPVSRPPRTPPLPGARGAGPCVRQKEWYRRGSRLCLFAETEAFLFPERSGFDELPQMRTADGGRLYAHKELSFLDAAGIAFFPKSDGRGGIRTPR